MGGAGTGVSWERLAEEAAGMTEGSECGDLLVPWQTVEFVSGMSRVWGKLAEGDRERVGWTRQVAVPGAVRLTLSVQTVPRWDPEGPEVGMGAANSELFPPCVFTVAAGSAGCRMARDFWEVLCREHGLREGDGVPRFGRPTGNWRGFFREETGAVFGGAGAGGGGVAACEADGGSCGGVACGAGAAADPARGGGGGVVQQ